jgi:hypothetical protein
MVAGKYNMLCQQGSTFTKVITYKNNGTAVNLTTYTARMQVRERHSSTATIVDLTTSNGGIVLGGSAGTITINISATATAAIYNKSYVYDLELVSGATVTRILEGKFIVTPEVTR